MQLLIERIDIFNAVWEGSDIMDLLRVAMESKRLILSDSIADIMRCV